MSDGSIQSLQTLWNGVTSMLSFFSNRGECYRKEEDEDKKEQDHSRQTKMLQVEQEKLREEALEQIQEEYGKDKKLPRAQLLRIWHTQQNKLAEERRESNKNYIPRTVAEAIDRQQQTPGYQRKESYTTNRHRHHVVGDERLPLLNHPPAPPLNTKPSNRPLLLVNNERAPKVYGGVFQVSADRSNQGSLSTIASEEEDGVLIDQPGATCSMQRK